MVGDVGRIHNSSVDDIYSASVATLNTLMLALFGDENGAKAAALTRIRSFKPEQP